MRHVHVSSWWKFVRKMITSPEQILLLTVSCYNGLCSCQPLKTGRIFDWNQICLRMVPLQTVFLRKLEICICPPLFFLEHGDLCPILLSLSCYLSPTAVMDTDSHTKQRGQTILPLQSLFGWYLIEWAESRWLHCDEDLRFTLRTLNTSPRMSERWRKAKENKSIFLQSGFFLYNMTETRGVQGSGNYVSSWGH